MSALGQKQTYAAHKLMSALPLIATAKADFPQKSCLLYPQERTCAVHYLMSAKGQKRTSRHETSLPGWRTMYKALHFLDGDKAVFIDVHRLEDTFVSSLKLL